MSNALYMNDALQLPAVSSLALREDFRQLLLNKSVKFRLGVPRLADLAEHVGAVAGPSCFHLFAADMVALDICLLDICLVI